LNIPIFKLLPSQHSRFLQRFLALCQSDQTLQAPDAPSTSSVDRADQFECKLLWLGKAPMLPGRPYRLKLGEQLTSVTITTLKYLIKQEGDEHLAATELVQGDIAVCNISTDQNICFKRFAESPEQATFMLCGNSVGDSFADDSFEPLAIGALHFALRRAQNIQYQYFDVTMEARSAQKGQRPVVLWFTGISGAGKSSIANLVEQKLFALGRHSYLLDGDNIRHGLNRDLGFTDADRVENIRRIAEVARLMIDAGLIVLTAFISPFRAERERARKLSGEDSFVEIFVDTSLATAEQRDVKGLYRKARSGQLRNFTGIDSPYEAPTSPAIHLRTENQSIEQSAQQIIDYLKSNDILM